MMTNTTETLDEWLTSQIKRDCTLESMIITMQEGGYALSIAQNHVVKAFMAAGMLGVQIEALSLNQSPTYLLKADFATQLASQPLTISTSSASSLIAQEINAQLAWLSVKEKRKVPACLVPVIQLDSPRVMVFEDFLSSSECDF